VCRDNLSTPDTEDEWQIRVVNYGPCYGLLRPLLRPVTACYGPCYGLLRPVTSCIYSTTPCSIKSNVLLVLEIRYELEGACSILTVPIIKWVRCCWRRLFYSLYSANNEVGALRLRWT
jgi:hypothetical protein